MDRGYARTDFSQFPHALLVGMLKAGEPDAVKSVAESWRDIANWLDNMAQILERQHVTFQEFWEGSAQQAHAEMIESLIAGVRRTAVTARQIVDRLSQAREALVRAQQQMAMLPAPVELRPLDDAVLAAASAPLPYGEARAEAAERQARAIRAIQEYQRARVAGTATNAAAASIMNELRNAYRDVDMPAVPTAAEAPMLAPDGTPVFANDLAGRGRTGSPEVLTGFWQNGLLATAGMPVTGLLPPYVPGYPGLGAGPGLGPGLGTGPDFPPPSTPPLTSGNGFDPGSLGGGSLGDRSLGGFGDEPPRAVGHSSLAPQVDPATAAAVAGGAGLAMAGSPLAGGMMGFPPMLGAMGAGAGGEFGGGLSKNSPAWLIGEAEEFGVAMPVVPDVIG
jgi:uncharacterized protein YukE